MPQSYTKQPFKVALLVLLLVLMAVAGSYMLYDRPNKQTSSASTALATGEAGWQIYTMHADALSFKYPLRWSVSETGVDSSTHQAATYVYSPDSKTTISITSNTNLVGAHVAGQLLASQPGHLFGKAYVWNYIKASIPSGPETGSSPGDTVTANLMTAANADATWPTVPAAPGERVSIIIQNFSATTSADQLQKIADVVTARRIAESLNIATQIN